MQESMPEKALLQSEWKIPVVECHHQIRHESAKEISVGTHSPATLGYSQVSTQFLKSHLRY